LALSAGKKRQSEETGFVHHCYEHPEKSWETIPIYENFCFALALLRSRTAENILKARALIERLLAFKIGGQFPIYLHEFPKVTSYCDLPISLIVRDFQGVIGEKLQGLLKGVMQHPVKAPKSAAEWGRYLVQGGDPTAALPYWNPVSLTYTGPQQQEKGEPAVTLFDLFMGEWGGKFSARALADHPIHLQASLIFPCSEVFSCTPPKGQLACHYWGDGNPTHSLVFHTKGSYKEEEKSIVVTLADQEVEEEIEIEFFLDLHPDTQVFVKGQKATTFQLGDPITLISKHHQIELTFRLQEGEGKFWGHILRGNRPGQLLRGEAYDQIIALRTVQRKGAATVVIEVAQESRGAGIAQQVGSDKVG
jgi:hypothetical protein